jgi:S-DNA-T family DNA segregation ATPase FtsK/SpoIIIE
MTAFAPTCGAALGRVLAEHKIAARPAGRVAHGARTIAFPLALRTSADLARVIGLDEEMAFRAGVESCRIARAKSAVLVEFELPRAAWSTVAIRNPGNGLSLKLGLDVLGRAARLDLGQAETAHVLCAGTTGSGKSFLLRALLWQAIQATPDRLQVLLVDTKRELERFYGLPHLLQPPARDASGAASMLEWVSGKMTERTAQDPPCLIVIDELADVVATSKATIPALARIARLGRSLGLHILAGTQYVSKDTLGDPQLKANLTCRLAGRVENAQASALATGFPDMGAHRLSGSGDFLLSSGGRAVRFTAPVLTVDQLATLPAVMIDGDLATAVSVDPPLWDPHHVGWVLAETWRNESQIPGRERIRSTLGLGASARAAALQSYCREVWSVMWPDETDNESEVIDDEG